MPCDAFWSKFMHFFICMFLFNASKNNLCFISFTVPSPSLGISVQSASVPAKLQTTNCCSLGSGLKNKKIRAIVAAVSHSPLHLGILHNCQPSLRVSIVAPR